MPAASVRRVRVHVPPKDGWPETVRGVGSRIDCPDCGVKLTAKSHGAVRVRLREHRERGCA